MQTMTVAADGAPTLPLAIEEITSDWLTAALRTRAPCVTVRGSRIVDVLNGTCTKIRVALDLDAAGRAAGIPASVILKGGFEPHSRVQAGTLYREVRGYTDVLPTSPLRSPACYFAGYDDDLRQGIVIMDDLVARGVAFCHAQRPQSPAQVARRLEVLARHHAASWGSPDLAPGGRFGWATRSLDNFRPYVAPLLESGVWRSYCEAPRGAATAVRFHDRDWMAGALDTLARLSDRLPPVLIHGDTHPGNLYIDIDGEPGFYDSLPQVSAAAHEIAYHITCALDLADRRAHEGALVRHYLEALARCGIAVPGHAEMMTHYGAFLALGYCVFIVNASAFQQEAINTAYTARFSQAMLDNDTMGILARIG